MLPQPLGSRVLIKPKPPDETTASGLVVVRDSNDPDVQGKVVAKGPLVESVNVGEHVLIPPDCGQVVTLEDDRYIMVHESDLLAVFDEDEA